MTAALVIALAVLGFARTAWAEQRRVAVLQPDHELLRAVSLALSPWGIETIGSDAALPKSSQPEAVQVASRLARQLGVEAVVWITSLNNGSLLWVFDLRTGDVTVRVLPEMPPFDSAAAAAVALSVKTVLRSSVVAPPEERFGAPSTSPNVDPISAGEIGAGGHWVGEGEVDFRVELAGVLWLPAARRLGLSLEVSSGPGLQIDHPDYSGRYQEFVAGAKARFRLVYLQDFSVAVALGGAAHWATLRGTVAADSRESNADRLNGSIDFETSVNFNVSSGVYLGTSLGTAYFPAYRRYLVSGEPVFAPWPLVANFSGYLGVELF